MLRLNALLVVIKLIIRDSISLYNVLDVKAWVILKGLKGKEGSSLNI
jgi:hypothetical protein